jgi:hypothetical protein
MPKHELVAQCVLALFSTLLLSPALQAEERVKGMSFLIEPLTIEAVPGKQQHLLVVLPQPGINSPVYALKGMVRYEDVEGDAYLQMNNDFGDTGVFFTKGVAPSGPLGKISGSSGWRSFVLPFYANQGDQASAGPLAPDELTLVLYLPAAGTVAIRDVKLYQYAGDEDPLASVRQGISERNPQVRSALYIFVILLFVVALVILIFRGRGGRSER